MTTTLALRLTSLHILNRTSPLALTRSEATHPCYCGGDCYVDEHEPSYISCVDSIEPSATPLSPSLPAPDETPSTLSMVLGGVLLVGGLVAAWSCLTTGNCCPGCVRLPCDVCCGGRYDEVA